MNDSVGAGRIRSSALGEELNIEECQVLANRMRVRRLVDGELLVAFNSHEHTLFVLVEGRIAVCGSNEDVSGHIVYMMKQGECAGNPRLRRQDPSQGEFACHWRCRRLYLGAG